MYRTGVIRRDMKLFIDDANVEKIKEIYGSSVLNVGRSLSKE